MGRYRINKIIKKRTTFGWLFYLIVAVFGRGNIYLVLVGIFLVITGEFFRTFAAGIIKKNQQIAKTGPYCWCRHPLYFGSFLISLGLSISANHPVVYIYFLIFFPLFYIPTIKKEEEFLTEKFKNEYLEYKKTTPAFVPRFRRIELKNFSWKQVKRNSEFYNWFAILIVYFVLFIKKLM